MYLRIIITNNACSVSRFNATYVDNWKFPSIRTSQLTVHKQRLLFSRVPYLIRFGWPNGVFKCNQREAFGRSIRIRRLYCRARVENVFTSGRSQRWNSNIALTYLSRAGTHSGRKLVGIHLVVDGGRNTRKRRTPKTDESPNIRSAI